jgi:outer membrane biosynthesis protein TonB
MYKTTVNDDGMKSSLAVSAGLHIIFMLFLYFGLPILFTPLPSHHNPVPFEIVDIADLTNTRIKDQEEPVQPPAPQPAPVPKQQAAPPQPAPKVEEKVEPLAMPKPAEKPKPPQEAKPKTEDFDKLLKDMTKVKPQEAAKVPDTKTDAKQPPAEAKSLAPALSNRLSITEEDALRRQISSCWNMPIGARDAQNLIVEIVIDVNPDRTVQHAEIVDQSRAASDSFYRAAAEAALRALKNPKCTPLELPVDKYEQWKRIDFTFDPRDML